MGALHAGHVSLIEAARRDGCFTVVSIFVNPTQFGPNEDFSRYPRDEARDLSACRAAGADLTFLPTVDEMYPAGAVTRVHVARLGDHLCGPQRPGHFEGVATVVAKLLNIVLPDAAYFGRKDAQQLAIVRQMVRDLDMPVEIIGCPTVREADGLAMSSRNRYLSPGEREQAASLNRALRRAETLITGGERDAAAVEREMKDILTAAGPCVIDYASVVGANDLQPARRIERPVLVALAVRIGTTRLIDNVTVDPAALHR